ncbi:MAG TPA: GerMN domain-containing protein [Vicinamibacterales bacterium]|jgi:spore germination protein GerM|nr:GerMN domain-containing protein [Vicinamibacterales bacterium]
MTRRALAVAVIAALAFVMGWALFVALPHWYRRAPPAAATANPSPSPVDAAQAAAARKITATLYYVSDDGMALVGTQKEVPYAAAVADQARAILEAQLAPALPLVSAIPAGTKLKQVFVTERGDAFVDFSADITAGHPGGSLEETLTVYTVVDVLAVNLPAITHVQILVDGKEVDTLAGHVDLRQPLAKSLDWVVHDTH